MERISQNMLYSDIINSLNKTTSRLQELQEQASTQKKVNRPSDNSVGYGRILNYRDSISAIKTYEDNVSTSKGWLSQSDDTMQQVQDVMTRIKELAVQASNDSLNEQNRESIYKEVRQLFEQMLTLSNTKYQGKSIFAGHEVGDKAYEKGVAVYSNKRTYMENYKGDKDFSELEPFEKDKLSIDDVTPYVKNVEGTVKDPVSIRFSNASGYDRNEATIGQDNGINYTVFQGDVQKGSGTLDFGETTIDLGDVKVELKSGYQVGLQGGDDVSTPSDNIVVGQSDGNSDNNVTEGVLDPDDSGQVRNVNFEFEYQGSTHQYDIDSTNSLNDLIEKINNDSNIDVQASIKQVANDQYALQLKSDSGNITNVSGKIYNTEKPEIETLQDNVQGQTELYLAPTAYYQGDTKNKPGAQILNNKGISVEPLQGSFDSDVRVKVDNSPDLGDGTNIKYKYSLDGGANWSGTIEAENTTARPVLDLAGGQVRLSYAGSNDLRGLQFDINGNEVVQNKKDVNMTTTDDFDNKVQIQVQNNPDISVGDSVDYRYRVYDETSDSWNTWNDPSPSPAPDLTANFDGSGGATDTETVTLRSQGDISTVETDSEFMVNDSNDTVSRVSNVHSVAQGNFDQNVMVRIDDRNPDTDTPESTTLGNTDQTIRYSYSTDGGETWTSGNEINQKSGNDYQDLVVPGGMLKLAPTEETGGGTSKLNVGDQFTIQPRNAEHSLDISQGNEVAINNLGPKVFGGHYKNESGIEPAFEEDEQKNLFLGLGKFMTSLKHNDQENISKSIGYIDSAIQQVSERLADVGARTNRVEAAENMLSELKTSQKERKSEIEDVDFAKLMSKLNKQNTVYQTILKSSSMIMRTSLVDYV